MGDWLGLGFDLGGNEPLFAREKAAAEA